MKRSWRQNLCVLAALLLGTSLLVTDYVDARGGGGGGSRGGGGGSRGGGGASPRVSRSSDLQNRGNFIDILPPSSYAVTGDSFYIAVRNSLFNETA
jgi:hypothetical protein